MSQTGAEGLALHGYGARAILAHYYTGTAVGRMPAEGGISVLLQSGLRSVVFSGATHAGHRPLAGARTYIAREAGNGEIALESERGRLLSYLPAPLAITSAVPIRFDGAASSGVIDGRYRGSLEVVASGSRLDVINHLGLEAYRRGVVPAESPSWWPAAELQAQAIAARGYAIASPPQNGFDLYGDTRSQAYGGYGAETAATNAAVSATTGEVVTYAGKPVITYYFASSGGATEDVQDVFYGSPAEPYLTGVLDPYDATRFGPITMSVARADRRLRGLVDGTLEAIDVTRRGVSPRVVSANLIGSGGTTSVSGATLEAALRLPSSWDCFTVSSSQASLASGWDRACERPTTLGTPRPATGPTGSTLGGAVSPKHYSGPGGSTGTTGTRSATGSSGTSAGGAVGPPP
jgi:stage II sporulation protein D